MRQQAAGAYAGSIHPAQASESYNQFVEAVNTGNQEFQGQVLPNLTRHTPGYLLIDVRRARQAGINPISH